MLQNKFSCGLHIFSIFGDQFFPCFSRLEWLAKTGNLYRFQDQATEVILTLGQAFEVAYQMALRDPLGAHTVRSQSANQLASPSIISTQHNRTTTPTRTTASPVPQVNPVVTSVNPSIVKPLATHGRSHSVNDIKINGNQLKLAPMPVDDINIGVRDMKAGSRAPIALSEEL